MAPASFLASLSPRTRTLLKVGLVAVYVAIVAAILVVFRARLNRPSGEELNRAAWEAAFAERGLLVPAGGPRDGYWGKRLPRVVEDPATTWREAEARVPGLVDVDGAGLQTASDPSPRAHVLIIGASVAWGAYASSIENTYFARLARRLGQRALPVKVTVLAAGAWESGNELAALREHGLALKPDLIVFLNGMNDLSQSGARRRRRRGGKELRLEERVPAYLENMREARDLALSRDVAVMFAPQPFILSKVRKTALEERVLELTLDRSLPEAFFRESWPRLCDGLRTLAARRGARFVDSSRVFDGERPTTFTDLWHFPDPGHALLADLLAREVGPALQPQLQRESPRSR